MEKSAIRRNLEDFSHFCNAFDASAVIAAAEKSGQADEFEKEVYALAIMRAAHNGAFGTDPKAKQAAISALWERGHRCGFTAESFNAGFLECFNCW